MCVRRIQTNTVYQHIYGFWKGGTDEPICRAAVDTQTADAGWGGGESGKDGGSLGETHASPYAE